MGSNTEEARLDALIASVNARSKPMALHSRAESSSQMTKKATPGKSVMNSRLDQTTRDTQYATPNRREFRPSDAFGSSPRRAQPLPDKSSQVTRQKSPFMNEPCPSDLFGSRPRRLNDNLTRHSQALRHNSSKSYQPSDVLGSRLRRTENSQIKTAFTNAHDIHMASRQTQYETLAPQEQKKQEEWAQKKLKELGRCMAGFEWIRVPGGYNCSAGNHWMSDAMVTEGRGGYVYLKDRYNSYSRLDIEAALKRDRRIGFRDGMKRFQSPIYDDNPSFTPWSSFTSPESSNPWNF